MEEFLQFIGFLAVAICMWGGLMTMVAGVSGEGNSNLDKRLDKVEEILELRGLND